MRYEVVMNALLEYLRPPNGGAPDWDRLATERPWGRAMAECDQDEAFHGEGSVMAHLELVHAELLAMPEFQGLPQDEKDIIELAVLFHDVGKPGTTRVENGRIRSPGHSVRGEIDARKIMWEERVPFETREAVCALVRFHQQPFHLLKNPDADKRLFRMSVASRCDHLAILAEADAKGRISDAVAESVENVRLFREFAEEHGCLHGPFPFPSDHSRFLYFQKEDRNPYYEAHDDTKGTLLLVSGLPGTGKSTWIREHGWAYKVIGLDETREEMGVSPTDPQGPVVQATKQKAREIMGSKEEVTNRIERSLIWNATNLSRMHRRPLIDLAEAYNYRVRIVYLETTPERLFAQNEDRDRPVPAADMERMFHRWEVPDRTEAQRVDYIVETN